MRVGVVVDCLAPSDSRLAVAVAARRAVAAEGVDLTITNQRDQGWIDAFHTALVKAVVKELEPYSEAEQRIHITAVMAMDGSARAAEGRA
jgi:hypothetical protein